MCRGKHRDLAQGILVGTRSTGGDLAAMVSAPDVEVKQHLSELPGDCAGILESWIARR